MSITTHKTLVASVSAVGYKAVQRGGRSQCEPINRHERGSRQSQSLRVVVCNISASVSIRCYKIAQSI